MRVGFTKKAQPNKACYAHIQEAQYSRTNYDRVEVKYSIVNFCLEFMGDDSLSSACIVADWIKAPMPLLIHIVEKCISLSLRMYCGL